MTELQLLYLLTGVCGAVLILCLVLLLRKKGGGAEDHAREILQKVSEESARTREFMNGVGRAGAEANARSFVQFSGHLSEKLNDLERRVEDLTKTNEYRFARMAEANARQLAEMRAVVDEKLSVTLNERLGKSFEIINARLEAVYRGLGEMQGLARGVGDIKKVLTNVKVRGTFGELQLSVLLEQILSPAQYDRNFDIGTGERVDFVIRLPGRDDREVFLPVDSKFPMEEYQRLLDAADACNPELAEKCGKALEQRVLHEGKKIADKYVVPPLTTDFAILYLPMEGLYAEVLKREGLIESLQKIHIVLCGPTTLGALLNSLQLGFKTLAIERRSAELWQLLAAFKTEFFRFTEILARTQRKLSEATDTIEDAAKKTRTIQRKLSSVTELGEQETDFLLGGE